MIFEIISNSIGAQSALCGGGRYDKLIEQLGGKPTPAVGFAAGLERLMLILKTQSDKLVHSIDIYIISSDDESISQSMAIADTLRNKLGIKVINETLRRSVRSQMREANRCGAKHVIIVGEEEILKKNVIIKDIQTSDQSEIPSSDVLNFFNSKS